MRRSMLVLSLFATAFCMTVVMAGVKKPLPPQSSAFGKPLAEWMMLYWNWAFGGTGDDHVGHVAFLPIPAGESQGGNGTGPDDPLILAGHQDWSCKPGTAFVLPTTGWIGETYDPDLGIPDDTPIDPATFTESRLLIMLDGKAIIDSETEDISGYYSGPVDFPEPIMYPDPTSYGSIGALWVQGNCFVHQPLSKGVHELSLVSQFFYPPYSIYVQYENTWTITVGR